MTSSQRAATCRGHVWFLCAIYLVGQHLQGLSSALDRTWTICNLHHPSLGDLSQKDPPQQKLMAVQILQLSHPIPSHPDC